MSYPQHPRSKVNRYRDRGVYDYDTIHTLVDTAPVLHVSFMPSSQDDDPFPTVLPMIGSTGVYSGDKDGPSVPAPASSDGAKAEAGPRDVYIHGSSTSRMMRMGKVLTSTSDADANNNDGDDDDNNDEEGIPLCICATHLDGYVLALTPMHNSLNYRSAVIHGRASLVTDPGEKEFAMRLITEACVPGRWAGSRVPPTTAEMTATAILRVRVVSASAKLRAGGPGEDRHDEQNAALRARVWTGVVPSAERLGAPVPASGNVVVEPPAYLRDWVEGGNRDKARFARGQAGGKLEDGDGDGDGAAGSGLLGTIRKALVGK